MISKNKNFILVCLVAICLSFIFTFYLWDQIKLNYVNEDEIVGHYSILKHHANNDILRFLFFISLPLIVYLIIAFTFYKDELYENIKSNFFSKEVNFHVESPNLIFFFLFICLLLLLIFLSKNLPIQQLDLFHEGQLLSGGYNFVEKKNYGVKYM